MRLLQWAIIHETIDKNPSTWKQLFRGSVALSKPTAVYKTVDWTTLENFLKTNTR